MQCLYVRGIFSCLDDEMCACSGDANLESTWAGPLRLDRHARQVTSRRNHHLVAWPSCRVLLQHRDDSRKDPSKILNGNSSHVDSMYYIDHECNVGF